MVAPTRHRRAWSAADERKLRQLAAKNTPTGLIAHELGRTEAAVRAKASELGVSLTPPNRSPYGRRK